MRKAEDLLPGEVIVGTGPKKARTVKWEQDGVVMTEAGTVLLLMGTMVELELPPDALPPPGWRHPNAKWIRPGGEADGT